jgi:hypothetical protein
MGMPKTPVQRIDFRLNLAQDANRIIPVLRNHAMPNRFGDPLGEKGLYPQTPGG